MAALRPRCLLRELRLKREMSQEELSQGLQRYGITVSQQLISQIERGTKNFTPLVWRGCSLVLDFPMESFFDWPPTLHAAGRRES